MVFQDPYASLNPRMTVAEILDEPLRALELGHGTARRERAREVLASVGLDGDALGRYPHAFSGGQRQRIGIARALAVGPDLIVCDEAVSALDLSVRGQVLNLLLDQQARTGVAYLFVSHDLGVVRHVSDRLAVMYLGRLVETGPTETVFAAPAHPYTRALLESVPIAHPRDAANRRPSLDGDVPDATRVPAGCRFHPRCPLADDRCRRDDPHPVPLLGATDRTVACHYPLIPSHGLLQEPNQ